MDPNFYQSYFKLEQKHWWFKVRRNIVLSLIKMHKVPKMARIFDFGCGSGYTVGYLQKLGYNASGIDISAEAIKFGQSMGIRNLSVAQNNEIKAPGDGFDLLLALDVIEHIENDFDVIKTIEKTLKPGGVAIITVPAYKWLWGVQDDIAHHYRRYTISSLIEVIKQSSNLVIVRKSYFNTFLFLPIAAVRLLNKCFNLKKRESDFDINNKWLNNLFFCIFDLERKFLKYINFPFGVSILAVVRKNEIQ